MSFDLCLRLLLSFDTLIIPYRSGRVTYFNRNFVSQACVGQHICPEASLLNCPTINLLSPNSFLHLFLKFSSVSFLAFEHGTNFAHSLNIYVLRAYDYMVIPPCRQENGLIKQKLLSHTYNAYYKYR